LLKTDRYRLDVERKIIHNSKLIFYHFSNLKIPYNFCVQNKDGDSSLLIATQWPAYQRYLEYLLKARRMLGHQVDGVNVVKPSLLKHAYWFAIKWLYRRIYKYY
jgi:hypothetical protein